MKTASHQLDTCGCIIEYAYDDDTPEDYRVHFPMPALAICPAHVGNYTGDNPHASHFLTVEAENRGKNLALKALYESLPAGETREVLNPETGETLKFFAVNPSWSFTEDRKLMVEHPALNSKAVADTFANNLEKVVPGLVEV